MVFCWEGNAVHPNAGFSYGSCGMPDLVNRKPVPWCPVRPAMKSVTRRVRAPRFPAIWHCAAGPLDDSLKKGAVVGGRKVKGEVIPEAFKEFDKNNDGVIDAAELKLVLKGLGQEVTDETVEEMIREVDVNGDGNIDYKEFQSIVGTPEIRKDLEAKGLQTEFIFAKLASIFFS